MAAIPPPGCGSPTRSVERLAERTSEVLEQCGVLGKQVQAASGHLAMLWKLVVVILVLPVFVSLRLVGWI